MADKQIGHFVYLYKFESGAFYIGRTFEDSKRFDNNKKYQGQFVYKYLENEKYDSYIICERPNAALIYWLEAALINHYYQNLNCLNVSCENILKAMSKSIEKYENLEKYINDLQVIQADQDWYLTKSIEEIDKIIGGR